MVNKHVIVPDPIVLARTVCGAPIKRIAQSALVKSQALRRKGKGVCKECWKEIDKESEV